jgi:hypothetical protein
MNEAGEFFVKRYIREDGTLIWRDEWPGMDGSDDGYERFFNLSAEPNRIALQIITLAYLP